MPLDICAITQETITPGQEFITLSGHSFNARALGAWVVKPKFRTTAPENASNRSVITVWLYGEANQVLKSVHLSEKQYPTLFSNIYDRWVDKDKKNPLTQAPLTNIELVALAAKITSLNHQIYFKIQYEEDDCRSLLSPLLFASWSLDDQYKWLDRTRFFCLGAGPVYWSTVRLAAYSIAVLAKLIVGLPNKIEPARGRYKEESSSYIWKITLRLMQCSAFSERNVAIMHLLEALPAEQQLSYVDLVTSFQENSRVQDLDLRKFVGREQAAAMFQTENLKLNTMMSGYIQRSFSAEQIAAAHGVYTTSGFQAPIRLNHMNVQKLLVNSIFSHQPLHNVPTITNSSENNQQPMPSCDVPPLS